MAEKMEALVYLGAGEFEWRERPAPTLQGADEILVRPFGVSTCDLDSVIAGGGLDGLGTNYTVGHEWVAEVTECGDGVTTHQPGDAVVIPLQVSDGSCRPCQRGRTAACVEMGPIDMFGLPGGSERWGGAMSDLVRIPHADHLAYPAPPSLGSAAAGLSDNVSDGWRTIGPYLDQVEGPVLIGGYASIGLYAVLFGVAAGLEVHYRDNDSVRNARAETLGAHIIETPPAGQQP